MEDRRLKVNCSPWGNFGDTCVPYMLKKLEIPFIFAHHTVENKLLLIGSILGVAGKRNTAVWGTGIMYDNYNPNKDINFIAVRGPRTLQRLKNNNINTDNILLGDTAMVLPKIYQPKVKKKYKLGIIPHIVDGANIIKHVKQNEDKFKNTIILDSNTKISQIEDFIDKVNSCEKIVSTSLHGCICAHAYGIPVKWMKISDNLMGDDVKFFDHFESIGLTLDGPIDLIENEDVIIEKTDINFDIETYWNSRPWLNLGDEYYVDINKKGWERECYPDNYDGKIVDDKWWK